MIVFDQQIAAARILVCDKTGCELDQASFNNHDLAFVNETFSAQPRRDEWLWGRLALKQLLQKVYGAQPHTIFVGRDQHERPILAEPADLAVRQLSVSVSHKPPFYMAGVSEGLPIGVDIETRLSSNEQQKFGRFISERERAAFEASGPLSENDYFILLWCVKEAYLKASGGTSIVQIKDSEFALTPRSNGQGYDVRTLKVLAKPPVVARGFVTNNFCAAVVTCT